MSPHRKHWDGYSYPGLTFRELINRHSLQLESKFLTSDGTPCLIKSRGILNRRWVYFVDVLYIGKEANEIDKVQAGLIDTQDDVLVTYERDPWEYIQPILAEIPVSIIQERTGYKRSMVYALRRGERRSSKERIETLLALVGEFTREKLGELDGGDAIQDNIDLI